MPTYHISADGNPRVCSAEVRACPLGAATEHYPSAQAATEAYEKKRSSDTFKKSLPSFDALLTAARARYRADDAPASAKASRFKTAAALEATRALESAQKLYSEGEVEEATQLSQEARRRLLATDVAVMRETTPPSKQDEAELLLKAKVAQADLTDAKLSRILVDGERMSAIAAQAEVSALQVETILREAHLAVATARPTIDPPTLEGFTRSPKSARLAFDLGIHRKHILSVVAEASKP